MNHSDRISTRIGNHGESTTNPSGGILLTATDVANLLRTTRRSIYAMAGRGQLPGITRIGRRLLFRRDDLLPWLDERRASSPKEIGR